jgi:hypothetical protein
MLDEHIEFLERPPVEQKLDALAGGQLATAVLRLDALFTAAELRTRAPFIEPFENVFHWFFAPGWRPRGRLLGEYWKPV